MKIETVRRDIINLAENKKPIIKMEGISKRYGHVVALDNVDFDIYENEIVGLVGDNGAGKSTLIKVLSGVVKAEEGTIYKSGQKVRIGNPHDAIALGIGTVYQDLALVDCLDVATNIFIGRFPLRAGIFINRKKMEQESKKVLEKIKIRLSSPKLIVGFLSGGQRQSLAIGRVLSKSSEVFVLDEPTAALGVREGGEVLRLILELKEAGSSIVVISHNLEHVFSIVDRLVVLRQGKVVKSVLKSETNAEEIVKMITGAYELNMKFNYN